MGGSTVGSLAWLVGMGGRTVHPETLTEPLHDPQEELEAAR